MLLYSTVNCDTQYGLEYLAPTWMLTLHYFSVLYVTFPCFPFRTQSDVNKMHMSNIAIVFCPTLQLSAPLFHLIYNNSQVLFGEVELKK